MNVLPAPGFLPVALPGAAADADDMDLLHLYAVVIPPSLEAQPGDFRHLTMRENYRGIVRALWKAANAEPNAWDVLAMDLPAAHDMSVNARIDRTRFNNMCNSIIARAGYGLAHEAHMALGAVSSILVTIAKHGWQGYMAREIAPIPPPLVIPQLPLHMLLDPPPQMPDEPPMLE